MLGLSPRPGALLRVTWLMSRLCVGPLFLPVSACFARFLAHSSWLERPVELFPWEDEFSVNLGITMPLSVVLVSLLWAMFVLWAVLSALCDNTPVPLHKAPYRALSTRPQALWLLLQSLMLLSCVLVPASITIRSVIAAVCFGCGLCAFLVVQPYCQASLNCAHTALCLAGAYLGASSIALRLDPSLADTMWYSLWAIGLPSTLVGWILPA